MAPPQLPGDTPVSVKSINISNISAWPVGPPAPREQQPASLPNVGKPMLPVLLVEGWAELQGPRLHSLEEGGF